MRFTVSPEQLKFFHLNGYLELEELISEQEASVLITSIKGIKTKSPGYPEENLFRSIPQIANLARKRGWGRIAAELLHKRPLRLKFDKFFSTTPVTLEPLEDNSCGILVNLDTKKAIFFRQSPFPENLYNSTQNCYLLLVVTSNFLPDKLNPIIVQ